MIVSRCIFMKHRFGFPLAEYVKQTVVPIFKVLIIVLPVPIICSKLVRLDFTSIYGLLLSAIALVAAIPAIMWAGLTKKERQLFYGMICNKIPVLNKISNK